MGTRKANPVDAEVGRRIKLQRLAAGLSQTELGNEIGVSFQQVQKYERGQTRVGASRLTLIAKVLNVPINEFFEDPDRAAKRGKRTQSRLELLSQPLALKLLQLFSDLPDRDLRQSIVQLVENIRHNCRPGPTNAQIDATLPKRTPLSRIR
jgi:transcriptional regulator with XRE-family HTH domain